MKYKLGTLLALKALKEILWKSIKNVIITEDLILKFEVDLKSNKGIHKKELTKIINQPIEDEYKTLLTSEMLADGYLCIPIKGGWVVINPQGEKYDLTENDCSCNDKTILVYDGPCKHLLFRDGLNLYRSRVNQEKIKRGLH